MSRQDSPPKPCWSVQIAVLFSMKVWPQATVDALRSTSSARLLAAHVCWRLSPHVCWRRSWLTGCSACQENVLEHLDSEAARVVADSGSTPLITPTRSKVLQHPKE
eukprot:128041-Rhodomonas_salina.1